MNEEILDLQSARKTRRLEIENSIADGFVDIDQKHHLLIWDSSRGREREFIFKSIREPTLLKIFLKIIDDDIIDQFIRNIDTGTLVMNKNRKWVLKLTKKNVYAILAYTIRIMGFQNRPTENRANYKPLRLALKEAQEHFKTLHSRGIKLGINKLEKLISLALLSGPLIDSISGKFQDLVFQVGESCAGDEKLFHFTGNSQDIRMILTKPDRVGLWFYELCAPLTYGGSYLLHTKLHHSN